MSASNCPPGPVCGECSHWGPVCGGQCGLVVNEADALGDLPLNIWDLMRWLDDNSVERLRGGCERFEAGR